MYKKQDFTLIELLVVVLIIGILAAVALPQYQKAVQKSRFAQLVTAARSLVQAQQVYYMANGVYADKIEDLDVTYPTTSAGVIPFFGNSDCRLSGGVQVACHLRSTSNQADVIFMWYFDNRRICCAYKETNFVGDQLCSTEMNTTNWYDGSGGGGASHCYSEK